MKYTKLYYFIGLTLLALVSLYLAISLGTVHTSWDTPLQLFWHPNHDLQQVIIRDIRMPRAFSAFITGASLALAGCLMQILLRNPLADPYILGVSGGAAGGALLALLFGFSAFWFSSSAFIGALLSMLLVFALAGMSRADSTRLLLTGVVTASGWGAIISFILIISPNHTLHSMLFWLMGDFSGSSHPLFPALVLLASLLISISIARSLNLLVRGEYHAMSLGVNQQRLRIIIYFLSALLTTVAVTTAGTIGFVGLIVPHMLRLMIGSDHRILLPAAVLLGGSLVCLADTVSRIIFSPQQIPVGIITALIGVPIFLYLLQNNSRRIKR